MSADSLTVLCCEPGRRAAKRYTSLSAPPEDYDAGAFFGHIAWPVSSLSALADTLEQLRGYPGSFVVRGKAKEGAPGQVLRRAVDRPGEPATFEPTAHHWVALDADETTTPFDPRDPRGSVERWRATLPEGLRTAACVFHFSAKQHQKPMVRGRAWFWSERPLTDGEGDIWSRVNGLDPCVFRTVQPIYTADPVFDGCVDPLDRTLVRLEGGFARFDLTPEQLASANAPKRVVEERELGEDNGLFYDLLEARGAIRGTLQRGKWVVECPKEQEHSAPGGEGTVLWAPAKGQTLGVLHCSHSNCGHDRYKAADWLACFSAEEKAAAEPGRDIVAAVASHAIELPLAPVPPSLPPPPASMTPPSLPPGAGLPVIVGDARGSQFWVLRGTDYFSPVAKGMLPARYLQASGGHGEKQKADDLAAGATIAEVVIRDFAASGICWHGERRAIVQGYALPVIQPAYDATVDAWLRAMVGRRYQNVAQWFASCAQSRIRSLAACLVLVGGTGIGKTLIALLAARMWGASKPVSLAEAIDKFNASITKCPIVLDDEASRMKEGEVSTNDFREMLSSRERTFEPKGVDKRELHGCQRFVITCNAFSDLRFSDVGALEVVEALADRLLVVQCGETDVVRAALQPLRLPDSDDVDFARLDGHVAWIVANTEVKTSRFLASAGRSDPAARRAVLDGLIQRYPELFDRMREAIDNKEDDVSQAVFLHGGQVWVRGDRAGGQISARDVYRALAPWEAEPKRNVVKIESATIRARAYNLATLSQELQSMRLEEEGL